MVVMMQIVMCCDAVQWSGVRSSLWAWGYKLGDRALSWSVVEVIGYTDSCAAEALPYAVYTNPTNANLATNSGPAGNQDVDAVVFVDKPTVGHCVDCGSEQHPSRDDAE